MAENGLFLIVSALAGLAMAVQGSLNSVLGKKIGLWESTLIVHIIGTLTVMVVLFIVGSQQNSIKGYFSAPWYTYLGGFLSVAIIFGVIISIARLGVANATTAIIVGQVSTAVLIDHLGLFGIERAPFTWHMAIGFVLLTVGAKLLLR